VRHFKVKIATVLAIALVAAGCGSDSDSDSAPVTEAPAAAGTATVLTSPIVIGINVPISGPGGFAGNSGNKGAELARAEVNAAGVCGTTIEFDIADNVLDVPTGLAIGRAMAEKGVTAMQIGGSSIFPALEPIIAEKDMLILNPYTMNPDIPGLSERTGRIISTINRETVFLDQLAEIAYNNLGLRRVALYNWNNDRGRGNNATFKAAFEKAGGTIVGLVEYPQDATDWRSELTQVKALDPEAVFTGGSEDPVAGSILQAQQLGLDVTWLVDNSIGGGESFFAQVGDLADGLVQVRQFDPNLGTATMKEFGATFKAKYNESASTYSAESYDSIKIFAEAANAICDRGGELTTAALVEEMKRPTGFQGVMGEIIFDPTTGISQPYAAIAVTVKGHEFVELAS